jgi:hypothetical protein
VSHLPLAALAMPEGAWVAAGTPVGTAAGASIRTADAHGHAAGKPIGTADDHGHAGLHLGVRREGRRFGYADPLAFLRAAPPIGVAPGPRPSRRIPPRPSGFPRRALPRTALPVRAPAAAGSSPLAPWPAWLGLALLLAGAAGAGTGAAARRRRRSVAGTLSRPAAEPVR